MNSSTGLRLAIDIGGTFTDTVLMTPEGQVVATNKLPTTARAPAHGALAGATAALRSTQAEWCQIETFVHGTTLATNALIERRGARTATITTAGFRDILEIAYERRYNQYDINLDKADFIVPRRLAFTVTERVDARGNVLQPLDVDGVADLARRLADEGVEAVAVCLLHAYANPAHELELASVLRRLMPELVVSLSHQVSPEAREFDRLCTTVANAYIQPLMGAYLRDLDALMQTAGLTAPTLLMTAGGGMTSLETAARLPIRLVESGPAGGAILAARLAEQVGETQVLSFDMGGTTAKLCLIDNHKPQQARTFEIARAERFVKGSGMPVRIPVIEMIEIGAGGGSIASVDVLKRIRVGPQSAGSEPGPSGFAKGGNLPTVTDADIVLGYILPAHFAEGRLQIDTEAASNALARQIAAPLGLTATQSAKGVGEIVDEAMASAARMHAVESGKNVSDRVMVAFGGNGPLHATRVARRAGVTRILVPKDPGVGSALGFLHAPVSFEIVRSHYTLVKEIDVAALNALFTDMQSEAEAVVRIGAPDAQLAHRRVAFMRYRGQGHEIEVVLPNRLLKSQDLPEITAAFESTYRDQFGRSVPDMDIEVLNWGLWVASESEAVRKIQMRSETRAVTAKYMQRIWCNIADGWRGAGVFERHQLSPGDWLSGPALIVEPQTTTFVSADFRASIDDAGNIWMTAVHGSHAS